MSQRAKALTAVKAAGLLNDKLTLSEVMEAATRLDIADGIGAGEENGWWAIVGPGYVVAGGAVDLEILSKTIQR